MKKLLVLGAHGMAGHIITSYLKKLNKYEIYTLARDSKFGMVDYYCDVEQHIDYLDWLINEEQRFDVVVNCIGLLNKPANENPAKAIFLNSYLPHYLELITKNTNTKIIHLSTDCIFDGSKGNHSENDKPTETNWYGRSKALGEIINNKDLTLRLSIIGTELKKDGIGLLNWILNQTGDIKGFVNCLWNGITTLELAKGIEKIIDEKLELSGLYHFAPDFNISKYDLLLLIKQAWNKNDINIIPETNFHQNKTLINNRKKEFEYPFASYESQLKELYLYTHV
jgi:dTDP-4-dehydrorhamnose reductase